MTIEHAIARAVSKPWGSTDLRPWISVPIEGNAIGELWFQHGNRAAPKASLLLKLLFTKSPLSIQVHPDDKFAQTLGLRNGKTEAWYILSAIPGAQVAVGLKHELSSDELRKAIVDGSIADLVKWRDVFKDDIYFIDAGTIHAIGAGIVLAEIQQNSDSTFRLFDYGSQRELHVENAVAATHSGSAVPKIFPKELIGGRTTLIASPYFVFEKIDLLPNSKWTIAARKETWLLVLAGHARINTTEAHAGDVMFIESDHASIGVGTEGMTGLMAYIGPDSDLNLLTENEGTSEVAGDTPFPPTSDIRPTAAWSA